MEIKGKKVLILGGWGLVGSAIARELVTEQPQSIVLCSLTKAQTDDVIHQMKLEFPKTNVEFLGEWGDIFQRTENKDLGREAILADPAKRRVAMRDILDSLNDEILKAQSLYDVLMRHKPDILIDCINSATTFAYQDVYKSSSEVAGALDNFKGIEEFDALKERVERLLCTSYTPQLIRHVQILNASMLRAGTGVYIKIGTSGTGGMGLNIPYTHSEERPSRVLLSKSAVAGAHTLLLFLMARTPNGPIIKEFKPTALIAWKKIQYGPIAKRGRPVKLYDMEPSEAQKLSATLNKDPDARLKGYFAEQKPDDLHAVYIDTGENGIFSAAEFEAITMVGQMQFITPEEIARAVIFELRGGNTGKDVINALDEACMGPTYRAGERRGPALKYMNELEAKHKTRSVAFEMLGPPKLSKLLWEAELLRRVGTSLANLSKMDPEELGKKVTSLITTDKTLRQRIISIGIPILMPDGKSLLRGPEMKIPVFGTSTELPISGDSVDTWASAGWVDLRVSNFRRWSERFKTLVKEVEEIPANDTSSRYDRNRDFWFGDSELNIGKIVGWLFINEDQGLRMSIKS